MHNIRASPETIKYNTTHRAREPDASPAGGPVLFIIKKEGVRNDRRRNRGKAGRPRTRD